MTRLRLIGGPGSAERVGLFLFPACQNDPFPHYRPPHVNVGVFRDALLLAQEKAAEPAEFSGLPFPVLMAIILLLGYLLVFRPQQKKQSEIRNQLETLKEKQRIVTIGGIHGQVVSAPKDSDIVTIVVDDSTGAKLRINKAAIAQVISDQSRGAAAKDN